MTAGLLSRLDLVDRPYEIVFPFEDPCAVPGNESPLRIHKPTLRHHLCPLVLGNPRLYEDLNMPLGARVREYNAGAEFES